MSKVLDAEKIIIDLADKVKEYDEANQKLKEALKLANECRQLKPELDKVSKTSEANSQAIRETKKVLEELREKVFSKFGELKTDIKGINVRIEEINKAASKKIIWLWVAWILGISLLAVFIFAR